MICVLKGKCTLFCVTWNVCCGIRRPGSCETWPSWSTRQLSIPSNRSISEQENQWRNNCCYGKAMCYIFLCVCVRACACVLARARAHACACARVALSSIQRACACCLRPLWPHRIFYQYFINGTIGGKKLLNMNCLFLFSLQLLSETFLIMRRVQREIVINMKMSSCKRTSYSCHILMKLEFSR